MSSQTRARAGGLLAVVFAVVAVAVVYGQKERRDPLPAFYFEVEIAGQTGFFRSVSGLSIETEVVDYQEGGVNDVVHKLPGRTKYANIRLSRAFTGDRSLYDFYARSKKPQPDRFAGRIVMYDRHGTLIAAWQFNNAFPAKWEGPDFDASKNELAIETIEIAHEGLTLENGQPEPPPPPPQK